jgi:hypothetical protein
MTLYTRRLLIAVPAADQARANTAATQFDPEGGSETFRVPHSPDGQEPATHYVCCASMSEERYRQITAFIAAYFPAAQVRECSLDEDSDLPSPQECLAALGLAPVEVEIP